MKFSVVVVALILLLDIQLPAQKRPPTVYNLIVSCTCEDSVGKGYARALRDLIAKSPRYEALSDTKENRKRALLISVVTLPLGDDSQGSATGAAISVVFVFDGAFVDQYVQTCSEGVTSGCAQKTFDAIDDLLNKI
jgi:hypothetical protein